jgi:sodium/potassium-transporting ATPase subunit alpha
MLTKEGRTQHTHTQKEHCALVPLILDILYQGLTHAEAARRLERDGPNELSPPPAKPWYVRFFEHMTGFFSLLLWGAAFLCFIAYGISSDNVDNVR